MFSEIHYVTSNTTVNETVEMFVQMPSQFLIKIYKQIACISFLENNLLFR